MTKIFCDRCEKRVENDHGFLKVYDHRVVTGFGVATLCKECSRTLRRWLYGEEELPAKEKINGL